MLKLKKRDPSPIMNSGVGSGQISKFQNLVKFAFGSIYTGGDTPVPIPNTEVKPSKVDGSVLVRVCESR